MKIKLTYGSGEVEEATTLAAFHAALVDAGIGNYNIIRLSSVIPASAKVIAEKAVKNDLENGFKLYAVLADAYAVEKGEFAVAGLGWVQQKNGFGYFVEHAGNNEEEVRKALHSDLEDMIRRESGDWGEIDCKIQAIECKGKPVCSIVAAIYETEGWEAKK